VLVARKTTLDLVWYGVFMSHRRHCQRTRVQQMLPHLTQRQLQSWAPFLKKGDVIPAIAVDPDPAKRPECIVIRIGSSMVNQTCALNQNYHFMLSDQMQSKYTFTGSQQVLIMGLFAHAYELASAL
jgi:hypothetical protein